MTFRLVLTLLLLLSTLSAQADEAPIADYSMEPLGAPLFDEAHIAVETIAINKWLVTNIKALTYEQMTGLESTSTIRSIHA
jgi:hypothetical protein